jgi:uncharacterized protein (UPF0548 family)
MKQRWQIRRRLQAMPDGQQRWDRAYQALLRWTEPTTVLSVATSKREKGEVRHACSGVRPGLHAAASPSADH